MSIMTSPWEALLHLERHVRFVGKVTCDVDSHRPIALTGVHLEIGQFDLDRLISRPDGAFETPGCPRNHPLTCRQASPEQRNPSRAPNRLGQARDPVTNDSSSTDPAKVAASDHWSSTSPASASGDAAVEPVSCSLWRVFRKVCNRLIIPISGYFPTCPIAQPNCRVLVSVAMRINQSTNRPLHYFPSVVLPHIGLTLVAELHA